MVTTLPNGQVAARVFPQTTYDGLFFTGLTADVWMEPGVTKKNLRENQASIYRTPHAGKVALVLGAGNRPASARSTSSTSSSTRIRSSSAR